MFKLFNLKWKAEFEQLKLLHEIEIAKKDAALKLREQELIQKHNLELTEAITLLKLDLQQQMKQKEIDYQKDLNDLKIKMETEKVEYQKRLQEDNYERLKNAMTKLHEEGNVTTKFTQDIAIKMLERVPPAKTEHKYLSGDLSVDMHQP